MMKRLVAAAVVAAALSSQAQTPMSYANPYDREHGTVFEQRERDWRNGAVVYQVLVDRFAPSADLDAKKALYPPPKKLRTWDERPQQGTYLEDAKVWSHEIDFWGGDLASTASKLDHVQQLGADVLYLNPIHLAYTNHKYDALDYLQVSPEYGSRADVRKLADDVHRRGMKLVLDGVFNHMGRNAPIFRQAEADPNSPYRDWFVFGPQYKGGARGWWAVANLPELNLENPKVREHIWDGRDSAVRSYLRDGVDGWRLDVAFDIGFAFLQQLTDAAHAEKPGSLVVGEIANYPKEWSPSVDGVMHFTLRHILLRTAEGRLDAPTAGRMITRMVQDTGIEPMLKSWIYLDNHDTERLATSLPDERRRRVAQTLQFTLPGSPNLYYGSEVGMPGGQDPEMRAPMRWDLVAAGHPQLTLTKQLVALHRNQRALKIGNYRELVTRELYAFERYTERAGESVFVIANPSAREVSDTVLISDSKIMDGTKLVELTGRREPLFVRSALLDVKLPPHTVWVLRPDLTPTDGYSNYKRVQ
jgi:cyclomaltodextrinase / maltogenic alpha-amylase / neopullulanase